MRSLYWKIFISFWLATILIIISTAWVTSHIAQKSSQPAREQLFMDSYANAAVATFESGKHLALLKWLNHIGLSRQMTMFLLSNTGEIIGMQKAPASVKKIAENLSKNKLSEGIFTFGELLVSHEILSTSGKFYRLVAVSDKPLSFFVEIPWAGITIRLTLAIFISGVICYLLSLYLTQPLRSLGIAATAIAKGKFSTRVGHFRGHNKDEIAQLSTDFDRMAEQLEALVHSKERLLQDISHELRSPLARLNLAIELGRNKTQALARGEFARMELESRRLTILINEILEFARLDKSPTDLHLVPTDMPKLLQELAEDANYEFSTKSCKVELEQVSPCSLPIDKKLVHRAIENIIRNAMHYSDPNKSVTLSLTYNKQKNKIFIDIKDKGPGVPAEQLKKIFNPFYRVDTSRTKVTGGYGLGLAIALRAINLHQGTIIAKNNTDAPGLTVRIILPFCKKLS